MTDTNVPLRRYLLSLALGATLVLGLMLAGLGFLESRGALPPPQFSNSLCMDEKLAFMRDTPPTDPDLLVAGSSVAWRHFNSPEAAAAVPGLRPYNAGLCGASLAQTEAVVGWLTGRLPSVRMVLLIASPVDFQGCSGRAPSQFDVTVADRYVFDHAWPPRYYARYFDPVTLLSNARIMQSLRHDPTSFDALVIDAYGDGPIEPPEARDLTYGAVQPDPACFDALRRTALALGGHGIALHVVMTPLHPEWSRLHDAGGRITHELEARIRDALDGTGATLLAPEIRLEPEAFFDAIHIRWSQTSRFTRALLRAMKLQAGAR